MPENWSTLFLEMFADFSQQVPSHSWGLVQVDRDLKGMKSLKGPFRKNTDVGNLFIWFGMGIQSRNRNSGKVFIRLLKPNRTTVSYSLVTNFEQIDSCMFQIQDLAAWDIETVETVLFAAYQKVGSAFYGRDIDQSLPRLEDVTPFWLLPKNLARHRSELCQFCHEGGCMAGRGRNRMKTIIRNPSSKGPNVAAWANVSIIAED
jgi:hypothetical protein